MLEKLEQLARLVDTLSEHTGRAISWLTLATVIVTFTVVILRYVFDTGSIALQESVTYLHALVFMLGAAYTLKHDGHVRVDIFYQRLTERGRAWINLAGTLMLLLPVCLFILLASIEYVGNAWSILEGSQEAGGLDAVFLLKTLIPVMAVLLLMQGISICLHSILLLRGAPSDTTETGPGHEL
ncbi:MAG: TRAP transporter small permease subunit [Gammaproteobacteria bacterium]|nr:MAG: TRAP transporter small permease subunit [Gammaproteobacteria bacterium]